MILSDLLNDCHLVSKNLQNSKLNIAAAASAVIKVIEEKRTEVCFDNYWMPAEEKAALIGSIEYTEPRARKVSRKIGEHWSTEVIRTGQLKLRVSLLYEVIDLLLSALTARFGSEVMPLLSATD